MAVNETDLLNRIKDRFNRSTTFSEAQYREMVEDLEFLNGEQWDAQLKADRADDNRPCLTINKLPTFVDQVVGDQRMNRPSIKIKPVDGGADKDTADILSGLIKNIEIQSNAAYAYDTAFDGAASCGFGAFRILTDYIDDESFEQEIKIVSVDNQFTAYFDPDAKEWDKADAEYLILTEMMSRKLFEFKYPDADISSFDAHRDDLRDWSAGDEIRVAEYYEKVWEDIKLYMVQVVGEQQPRVVQNLQFLKDAGVPYKVIKERESKKYTIRWYRVTGTEIIEGPIDYPGRYFPVIPVFGKKTNIEGRKIYRGIVRHAKDSQRLYNYNRSMGAEHISLAPKAPFLATPIQLEGHEKQWEKANIKNFPFLYFNPDPQQPGAPQRQFGPSVSTGIQNEIMVSDQEMHDTTGLQRSSLGKQSNEKSGKAIIARQREGDVGSYDFTNSFIMALQHAGKVILDLIPKIYDTERVIRIIGDDGEESMIPINQRIEAIDRAFDFSVGRYDVVISTGPSFTTQREQARAEMIEFLQYYPQAGPMVGDLIANSMDWPNTEKWAERLKPPGTEQPTPQEQAEMEIVKEAQLRKLQAEVDELEKKAEKIELENIKLAKDITEKEIDIAQKTLDTMRDAVNPERESTEQTQ